MKRNLLILGIYTVLIFAICLGVSFFIPQVPELNLGDEKTYRFFRCLTMFLHLLPTILLSGSTVAYSRIWQKNTKNTQVRFSPIMFERYRNVMIASLVCVFIVSANQEIFRPLVAGKIERLISGPSELKEAKSTAQHLLDIGEAELAYPYAMRAVAISPKDKESLSLLNTVKNTMDLAHDRALHESKAKKENAKTGEDSDSLVKVDNEYYTIKQLLEKSTLAFENKDWFNAHYWASIAVQACKGTDTNLQDAYNLANEAWNNLKNPVGFNNEAEQDYYAKKIEAYSALNAHNSSDNIKAYYDFLSLKSYPGRKNNDPDVDRFFILAEQAVQNDYFFIDETDNLKELTNNHNIYFSLKDNKTGGTNIFYIKGSFDTKQDGRTVRYLDGLTVVSYSPEGKFIRSMYAPIAKVTAQPTSIIPKEQLDSLGIDSSWSSIPYIMLQALDRETRGQISTPVYSYEETGLTEKLRTIMGFTSLDKSDSFLNKDILDFARFLTPESKTVLLPMPFSDFTIINGASAGPSRMDLVSLSSFLTKVTKYGFSYEVFANNLVSRMAYPLFALVLFIFVATMGWNYRIEGAKSPFKFRWIFLVPIYGAIIYIIVDICTYLYFLINYVIVGFAGSSALLVAFVLYLLLFIFMSVNFLRHRDS